MHKYAQGRKCKKTDKNSRQAWQTDRQIDRQTEEKQDRTGQETDMTGLFTCEIRTVAVKHSYIQK
jgi:hypothetical protein